MKSKFSKKVFLLRYFSDFHLFSPANRLTSSIILLVILLTIILRVYNFSERWGLGSDDTRDILIAKEALRRTELPLIGSFSSAGPFVFGPLFYWFIMISYILLPFTIIAPWIFLTIIGVMSVILLMYLGYLTNGRPLAIIVGIFAAISPQLITRSISLSQHSLIAMTTTLLLLFFVLLWKKKKKYFSFLMGISLGIGLSMHYQVINLFIFFPLIFLIPGVFIKEKVVWFILMILGFLIPSIPLLIWDARQEFANIRNILDYLLIAQYRIYVPNSWKLFLFNYFPNYWSFVVGGFKNIALIAMAMVGVVSVIKIITLKMPRMLFILGGVFSLFLLLNRYYKGERFEGYLLYFAPFIIFFTAWSVNQLVPKKLSNFRKEATAGTYARFGLAVCLFLIFSIGSLVQTSSHVLSTHSRKPEIERIQNILLSKYPNEKFSLYDFEWKNSDKSYPLVAFLALKDKIDSDGRPIGFIWDNRKRFLSGAKVIGRSSYDWIVDLSSDKIFLGKDKRWVNVNPESIYDDLMYWSKSSSLKSSFSPTKFIIEKIQGQK